MEEGVNEKRRALGEARRGELIGVRQFLGLAVFFGVGVGSNGKGEVGAEGECIRSNESDRVRNDDAGKAAAITECFITNISDGVRNDDVSKAAATKECIIIDGAYGSRDVDTC